MRGAALRRVSVEATERDAHSKPGDYSAARRVLGGGYRITAETRGGRDVADREPQRLRDPDTRVVQQQEERPIAFALSADGRAGLLVPLLEVAPGVELRSGIYFVRLQFGAERRTARVVVLR